MWCNVEIIRLHDWSCEKGEGQEDQSQKSEGEENTPSGALETPCTQKCKGQKSQLYAPEKQTFEI